MSDQPSPPSPPSPDAASSAAKPAAKVGGVTKIVWQFGGMAAVGCLIGLATVIVPLAFGHVFYVLPIAGLLAAVQAVRGGRQIGGVVGIVLNAVGGILTVLGVSG